jgi:hypothetical protein
VNPSKSLAKVMTLRIRQEFSQKPLQWELSSAIVRSCNNGPKSRNIAQVGADAQCIREGPWRHGEESVREVAFKVSHSRRVRCSGLVSLGRAELQKAAPPTHHMNPTRCKGNYATSLQKQKEIDVGRIRTYAPEGTRFLVLRDNHSATTPEIWLVD